MTENYISNNIELNWMDRPVKKNHTDPTNKIYKKIISIVRDQRDGTLKYHVISHMIIQSDYPSMEPDKLLKIESKQLLLDKTSQLTDCIQEMIKGVFKEYVECDKVMIEYISPSTNSRHEQIFYRDDRSSLLQSCFVNTGEKNNQMPLDSMLKDYSKMFISLFSADNVKEVIKDFVSLSKGVIEIIGMFKR